MRNKIASIGTGFLLICIIVSIIMPSAVLAQGTNTTFTIKTAKLLAKVSRNYLKPSYEIEPFFNKQGTNVAYIVKQGYKKAFVVANGKKGPNYRYIENGPHFTSDGKSYTYIVKTNNDNSKGLVFLNNKLVKKIPEYPGDGAFLIGGQLVHLVQHNLVIGDYNRLSIPDHPFATRMVISPDEKRVAYVADSADNYVAVTTDISKKEKNIIGKPYPFIMGVIFSPDNKKIAYVAEKKVGDKRMRVVVNGEEEGPAFETVGYDSLVFSPDSKQLAYVSNSNDGESFSVIKNDKVVADYVGSDYGNISKLSFSLDGTKFAYAVNAKDDSGIFVNGEKILSLTELGMPSELIFSPDGTKLAQVYDTKIVIDGTETPFYDGIYEPAFSPDGEYLNFGALERGSSGGQIFWVTASLK